MKGFRPPKPTGSTPKARFDIWVWETLARLNFIDSATVKFNERTTGISADAIVKVSGGTSTPVQIQRLNFQSMFKDYFITTQGIAVALPWLLRGSRVQMTDLNGVVWNMTYFDDLTNGLAYQARKKVSGNYVEYQRITPRYSPRDEIVAVQMFTGLSYLGTDGNEHPVDWQEFVPQRMWARRQNQSGY